MELPGWTHPTDFMVPREHCADYLRVERDSLRIQLTKLQDEYAQLLDRAGRTSDELATIKKSCPADRKQGERANACDMPLNALRHGPTDHVVKIWRDCIT